MSLDGWDGSWEGPPLPRILRSRRSPTTRGVGSSPRVGAAASRWRAQVGSRSHSRARAQGWAGQTTFAGASDGSLGHGLSARASLERCDVAPEGRAVLARLSARRDRDGEGLDIVTVFEHYSIPIHSGRSSQMVRCPFHGDSTPSLSVDLNKDVWNCHSCGEGGNAWQMVLRMEAGDYGRARSVEAQLVGAAGDPRGGRRQVSGGGYTRGRSVSPGAGRKPRDRTALPPWLRH
ncbi:CHC2 zinc finger domain-containing protein [Salana multivorans]